MQESTRTFFMRVGTACAAAALVLGSTFVTESMANSAQARSPAPTAKAIGDPSEAALPGGLEEALGRDLDMTKAEFDAAGELAQKALEAEAAVEAGVAAAQVSVRDGTIHVHTATADVDAEATEKKLSRKLGAKVEVTAESVDMKRSFEGDVEGLAAEYFAVASDADLARLQAVTWNGEKFTIRTGALTTGKPTPQLRNADVTSTMSAKAFASQYANVAVEAADGPASATADEVVAGQGYGHETEGNTIAVCSIGWNGFNKAGDPAIISAGHCTHDGDYEDVVLTDPEADQADGFIEPGVHLGTFGFSQFGGEGNAPISGSTADDGNIGTDVAVIDDINPDLDLLPQVTDWKNVADLTDGGYQVTGVSTAVLGAEICKSGRTTGWTCGVVDEIAVFLVGGVDYPADGDDIRAVKGFGSFGATNDHGDSGGAVISGSLAVGITSAGGEDADGRYMAYSADLKDALDHTDGYTVELAVNTAELVPADDNGEVETGTAITGTVSGKFAPATSVLVTIDGEDQNVAVKDGKWSFTAPATPGKFSFTVQGKNGFSTSETRSYTLMAVLAAPVISTPKDGQEYSYEEGGPATIAGTGIDGAAVLVTVNGDIELVPVPEPTDPPTTPVPGGEGTPALAGNDGDGIADDSDEPPNTEGSTALTSIGAAGGVLLLAGVAFMLFRRRELEG